jgi:hypothetical protein
MRYISLFDNFGSVDESYNFDSDSLFESKINQMLSLRQNGCAPGMTLNEFKDMFRNDTLLESRGYDESEALLEKAHSVYELGMLQESKSHWFDEEKPLMYEHSKGVISYLEFEGNVLLFKEGEAFAITENSLKMIKDNDQSINEDLFNEVIGDRLYEYSFGDFCNDVGGAVKGGIEWVDNNVVQPVKKVVKEYVVDPLKKAWDALTDGAKKLYEFSKKVMNAIATFVTENWQDIAFYVSVALQVIAGIVAFIPAAGQAVGPTLLIIAGGIQIFTGGYDVYEGVNIVRECPTNPFKKAGPEFIKGGTKLLGGAVSVLLGIHDIATSPKGGIPGGGATSTAVAVPAKSWVTKTVSGLGTTGAAVGMFETLIKFLVESAGSAGTKALTKAGAKKGAVVGAEVLGKAGSEIIGKKLGDKANEAAVPMFCIAGQYALGWLWDIILGAVSGIGKLINGILDLPTKTVNAINNFNEEYSDSTFGWIVGGALKLFVQPVAKVLSWFCENKIKPLVKPITNWMVSLGKNNKSIKQSVESKPSLKAAVSGGKIPQPKGGIPAEKIELTAEDKQNLAKIQASKSGQSADKSIAKEGGFFDDIFKKIQASIRAKVKAQQEKLFKDKFPGIIRNKSEGDWHTLNDGTLCFKYKSKSAHGSVVLYNNGRYQVKDGPNEGIKGNYTAKKNIDLQPPKEGFKKPKKGDKKNESRNYISTFESFSFS